MIRKNESRIFQEEATKIPELYRSGKKSFFFEGNFEMSLLRMRERHGTAEGLIFYGEISVMHADKLRKSN